MTGYNEVAEIETLLDRLKGKKVKVTIYACHHPDEHAPESIVEAYGSHAIRTIEHPWGNVFMGRSNVPVNSADAAFYGIDPRFPFRSLSPNVVVESWMAHEFFNSFYRRYTDLRGVDQLHFAGYIPAIRAGTIKLTPSIQLPFLDEAQEIRLTAELAVYLLNCRRDYIQAYFISRLAAFYDNDEIDIGHVGGSNHVALPQILREVWRLDVAESPLSDSPSQMTQFLYSIITVNNAYYALNLSRSDTGDDIGINYEKLLGNLMLYPDKLNSLLR